MRLTFGAGINELNDIAIDPTEAIAGYNFELGLGNNKLKPRSPFDLLGTTPNASQITGIHQLIERNGTKSTIIMAGTSAYKWDGASFTSLGTANANSEYHSFDWDLDQTILITDRNQVDVIREWDGTTLSNLTHGITGVTSFYAKYGIVSNGRAVLANVKTDTTTNPHMIVFSAFENRQSFDTSARGGSGGFSTGDEAFYLLSPDMKPINGLTLFKNILICSTEDGQLFKLVGNDATNYQWVDFYSGSAAIGVNSMVNAGNDVYYMRQGGVIESLKSTDTFGDVGTDDISLPVRDTVKDSTGTRIVYDQTNRKIFFFLGSEVLVLFKDLLSTGKSPFSIYKADDLTLNPSAAAYIEYQTSTDKTVMWGDVQGRIFDMNGTGKGDAGQYAIETKRKLALQDVNYKSLIKGRVFYRRKGTCELSIDYEWGDERSLSGNVVPLKASSSDTGSYFGGGVYFGGNFYFGGAGASDGTPVSQGFSAVGKGTSVFVTLTVNTSEDFAIDYIEV